MCIIIYPVDTDSHIHILFAMETVFFTRDGGKLLTIDVLIQNTGGKPINHLRMAYPECLVDVNSAKKTKQAEAIIEIDKLKQIQLNRISLKTEELAFSNHDRNWIYSIGQDIKRVNGETTGHFAIERQRQGTGDNVLSGSLKYNWHLSFPEEMDHWLWLALASGDIAIFDLKPRHINHPADHIEVQEKTWFRILIDVQANSKNEYYLYEKIFCNAFPFSHIFRSPLAIEEAIRKNLERVRTENANRLSVSQAQHIMALVLRARAFTDKLLPLPGDCEVNDWRAFFYLEQGLATEKIVLHTEPSPRLLEYVGALPVEAIPKGYKRRAGPNFLQGLFKRAKQVVCKEFRFGMEQKGYEPNTPYAITFMLYANNSIYSYAIWISLILSILSLLASLLPYF